MFNVIMRHYEWADRESSMPLDRMFEYTEQGLAARFKNGDQPALDRLIALPCLFIPEGTHDEVCHVGTITAARIAGGEVRFEYALDPDVPPLTNAKLFAQKRALDMDNHRHDWDWSRTHWAVKNVDLYRFLLRNVNPRRQRPSVFPLAEHEAIEPQLMSVMMPFDAAFGNVYAAIQQAAINTGLAPRRVDEIWENPGIIQDVVSLIDRGRIIICDLTGRNPNVFYEAGIAHTLGREVIMITQSAHDVPFDLRHLRYIPYLNNHEGLQALTVALQGRIQTILGH
jgi:hypothetical protein